MTIPQHLKDDPYRIARASLARSDLGAKEILRRVNSHEALVKAARAALPTLIEASMCDWSDPQSDLMVEALRAALAQATGEDR